jgi:hypothetical protein
MISGTYPFGAPLRLVVQDDLGPKRVFVLGVYSSAVHAKWIGPNNRLLVRALAVASEPSIFWDGSGVEALLREIKLPKGAGHLEPAEPKFNGPSGRSLDEDFLSPLGISRRDAWLCDLVAHTCLNDAQKAAIDREYVPRARKLGLAKVDLPGVPKSFTDEGRRREILDEVARAEPEVLVVFGDQPLKWWVRHVAKAPAKLSEFGEGPDTYGRLHDVEIAGRTIKLLPLAHPRQVAGLGTHSGAWRKLHQHWKAEVAPTLL